MHLIKASFRLLLIIMLIAVVSFSQGIPGASLDRPELDEKQVEQWADDFTDSLFDEMNPRQTLRNNLFLGKLTKDEARLFPRWKWLNPSHKKIPKDLLTKYFWLQFERAYFESYFSIGTKQFSTGFDELLFDDNGFTTIENLDYENILTSALNRNRISKNAFIDFFHEDSSAISSSQIIGLERVFKDVLGTIKAKINKSFYDKNVEKIKKVWEIEQISANRNYYLATNPLLGRFVVGKKDGRVQIVYFPDSDD